VIGAVSNNNEGVAGVCAFCKNLKIMAVKFLDKNLRGTLSGYIKGIEYALKVGARISNNSWGSLTAGVGALSVLASIMLSAQSHDHMFIGAAGNTEPPIDLDSFAGAYLPCGPNVANLICVTSHDIDDKLSLFSNFGGSTVDATAPGGSIQVAVPRRPETAGGLPVAQYGMFSGTSFSTAFMSGTAVLLKSFRPLINYANLRQYLLTSSVLKPQYFQKVKMGGRLNARRAMAAAG
jgi:subtilisin family serine protease